jgi:aminoglycoside 3-N-acetyltransferase
MTPEGFHTSNSLAADLVRLGVAPGDLIMVHAACSKVGPVLGGPDAIIAALRAAVGTAGTVMAYLDWEAPWEDFADDDGTIPADLKPHVLPFDPALTRAARDNGVLPEFLRTTPGALRSGNPGASVAAIGVRASWITADHPLDYGYGPGTPLARLVEAGGKVLMLGAPLDTMTLLHHAEHLAALPDKRLHRVEVPIAGADGTLWQMIEEYDTGDPVVDWLPDNIFELIVEGFLGAGHGRRGVVADAESVLVEAREIVPFAVEWLERAASLREVLGQSPS